VHRTCPLSRGKTDVVGAPDPSRVPAQLATMPSPLGASMRRREFISIIGVLTAWPIIARTQHRAMPVIGLLDPRSPDALGERLRAFHRGLKGAGYIDRENVTIEYRWADNQMDRLPALAAELVSQQVSVIISPGGLASTLAAKKATTTIPIVFAIADDPVRLGLVASLAQPGGNLTGINFFSGELTAKRLALLHELVPTATRVAVLINPANAVNAETTSREVTAAAHSIGLQIQILNASTSREIDAAFATFARERPHALFVGIDPFFNSRRIQMVHLATLHKLPASYPARDFAEAGGLMSYGANIADAWRQAGVYTGRILQGAKPADLPVAQSNTFELVINAQTARTFGFTVPSPLLARADEVIE
jgi:putative tryptophan/tyrosine transport system substrate-binding protein